MSLVRGVAPGGWIRRRSAERSDGQPLVDAITEISAVNRAQARRVRQIKPPNAHRDDRVGILIIKSQVIRSVEKLVQRQRRNAARIAGILRGVIAAPVSREIPMRAADAADVCIDQEPDLPRTDAARLGQVCRHPIRFGRESDFRSAVRFFRRRWSARISSSSGSPYENVTTTG